MSAQSKYEKKVDKINECLPKPHDYKYEKRLVAYIDILGWGELTKEDKLSTKATEILTHLDSRYAHYDNQFKSDLSKVSGIKQNPLIVDIQIGFFSDGFILSMPESAKGRIFNVAETCGKLLMMGILCRGAIIRGLCYHRGNRAFGPAINEVIRLEVEESIYPRILCSDQITSDDKECVYTTTDCLGRKVLNIFNSTIFCEQNISYKDAIMEVENKIKENIKNFSKDAKDQKVLDKWKYARRLMEDQLKESFPEL